MAERESLDLDAFRALYPWPAYMLERGKPLEWLWIFDLRCDRELLWSHLADTSRLNRALGLGVMAFEERDGALHGASRPVGIRQEWIEEPWDWVAGHSLQNVRVYRHGFAHFGRAVFHVVPLDDDTVRFYAYFGHIPRNVIGAMFLRLGMSSLRRGLDRVLARLVEEIAGTPPRLHPSIYQASGDALPESVTRRIDAIRGQLRQKIQRRSRPELDAAVDKLIDYVSTGDELDVYRIQVKVLASLWALDELDALHLCLQATRLGLLRMSWDVICPHCRGVREEARSLGDVPRLGECAVCEIDFSTDKKNAIEITFHVHPSVRDVPRRFYCSAEPASKDHIQLQKRLLPGAEIEVGLDLAPGRYRMRVKGEQEYRFLDVTAADVLEPVFWRAGERDDIETGRNVVLQLMNDTDAQQTFIVEKALWSDVALRPADLFNLQEFRDLFSEEYLAADIQLDVGEQTILFTDVVGSTRFYATRGDPEAFVEIKKHFTELYEIVGRHRGAVVKTIGDAVMAAFGDPLEAVKAARTIHECYGPSRADTPLRLRISLNTGPCIAVNLQSNIDYFGGTVNLAAKLQACAEAGEIAMAGSVVESSGVRDYLTECNAVLEELDYKPPALDDTIRVTRWSTFIPSTDERAPAKTRSVERELAGPRGLQTGD